MLLRRTPSFNMASSFVNAHAQWGVELFCIWRHARNVASRDQCLSSGFTGDHVKTYFRAIGGKLRYLELKLVATTSFLENRREHMEKQARRDNGEMKLFKIYNQAFSTVKKLITNRIHNVYFIFFWRSL